MPCLNGAIIDVSPISSSHGHRGGKHEALVGAHMANTRAPGGETGTISDEGVSTGAGKTGSSAALPEASPTASAGT